MYVILIISTFQPLPFEKDHRMSNLSVKDKRYDRQLRLWGDHGQMDLESAHICLINATGTGTEILKNLVLPGIGAFTILDSQMVSVSDLDSNFFVTSDKVGTSRATCTTQLLCELNTEVRSNVCTELLDTILDTSPQFFSQFTVVIATDISEEKLKRLAEILWSENIPLLIAKSYGLIGYLRLVVQSHEIIESHPDNSHEDMRLDKPFPSLIAHVNGYDLDSMDNTKHLNVPFLIIMFKYLDTWKGSHDGNLPKTYREKKEFKEVIRNAIRTNDDGVPLDEENFDEAIQNVNSMLVPTTIPSVVKDILDNEACTNLTNQSNNFWLLVRALREFVANEGDGFLPVRGSIPDMTSSSDLYIDLQRVYQTKARLDMEAITSHLIQILISLGKPESSISESEIKLFCRNSAFLRVVCTRSLTEELALPNIAELGMQLSNPESTFIYYVLLRASERFFYRFKTYPGTSNVPLESDISQIKLILSALLNEWGLGGCTISDEHVQEFCCYGATELHSVASYLGGVASQEVIKLITHQYVPINNTYIYNAASSTSSSAVV